MNGRPAGLLLAALTAAPALSAQRLAYEGGLAVATGDYIFASRTTSWSLLNGLAVESGALVVRLAWPVYLQNTTLVSLSSPAGGLPTGGSSSGTVADSGTARRRRAGGEALGMMTMASGGPVEVPNSAETGYRVAAGDPIGQLTWRPRDGERTSLAASVLVKAPAADTASFGTGQWDAAASVALGQRLATGLVVRLTGTVWHLGDLETLDFRDPVYGTVMLSYTGGRAWSVEFGGTAGTTSLDGYDAPRWLAASLWRTGTAGSWGVSGTVGLSETVPDLTLGAAWRVPLLGPR